MSDIPLHPMDLDVDRDLDGFDLHQFLAMHGCEKYEATLRAEELDSPVVLRALTEQYLDDIGIKTVGGKIRLLNAFKSLQPSEAEQPILIQHVQQHQQQQQHQQHQQQQPPQQQPPPQQQQQQPQPRQPSPQAHSLPVFLVNSTRPPPSLTPKSHRRPPRCSHCCMYKMKSIDPKDKHNCNPALLGHSWAECPTKFEKAHKDESGQLDKDRLNADGSTPVGGKRKRADKTPQQLPPLIVPPGWDQFADEYMTRLRSREQDIFGEMSPDLLGKTTVAICGHYDALRTIYQQQRSEYGKGKHRKKIRVGALKSASVLLNKTEDQLISDIIGEVLGLQPSLLLDAGPSGIPPPVDNKAAEEAMVHITQS